jgi:hypothetical protein
MIDFANLRLKKANTDFFVGIRKSNDSDGFEFCLPNGFDDFPEGDFNALRDFFFRLYRTFRKFEKNNEGSSRFKLNNNHFQREQDQATLAGGGIDISNESGDVCILYSKIKMIEKILEAYDDLTISSIQSKSGRSQEIDYSQIHKYLDRAIYLEGDVIFIDAMNLPRAELLYESTDLVCLYCYILDEIIQQLEDDVPESIASRSHDVKFLSQRFKDKFLLPNQSLFSEETFEETIQSLKETLETLNINTFYKDSDYWKLFEAVETFLYGELNSEQGEGDFWGARGFSLIWEDMCHTYYFKNHHERICYADTDICLPKYANTSSSREAHETDRVGNHTTTCSQFPPTKRWLYSTKSRVMDTKRKYEFQWYELLCIEYPMAPVNHFAHQSTSDYRLPNEKKPIQSTKRRFPKPDLILMHESGCKVIDFKDMPLHLFLNPNSTSIKEKVEKDVLKQLVYELAIQQHYDVFESTFFIPKYVPSKNSDEKIGDFVPDFSFAGIRIFEANFMLIQQVYLAES